MKLPVIPALGLTLLAPLVSAQEIKLLPSDGATGDLFGYSVAISGNTAIVGAHGDDDNGIESGSAYLFDATTGTQRAKLLPSDGAAGDFFGYSVAISGNTAIVGARYDDDNGSDSGSAYLFDIVSGAQIAKLLPSDGAIGDYFGDSVALSDNTAIIGAHRDDDNGLKSGSAYLFDITSGAQTAKLLPSDGASDDEFGSSVSISGTTVIVGAPFDDDVGLDSGSAYLFDSTSGAQLGKLTASDGNRDDWFGRTVSIHGEKIIVSAHGDDDNGDSSGSAYIFNAITGAELEKGGPSDGAAFDYFGSSVAISGDTVIVGALNDDDNGTDSGSAYLFSYCSSHVANYCIASPNSASPSGAPISSIGTPSLSLNNMALRADSLPPNQFGVFFCGPLKQDPPVLFGDGFRCVGTLGLARLNPPVSTGSGSAQRVLDMTANPLSNVQAGDTYHFQFWYRDPAAGGAGYNLSDGLEITFCP